MKKFALLLYASADKTRLGAKLYKGFENKKRLVALCERDQRTEKTEYAFLWEGGLVDSGEESLRLQLDDAFDPHMKRTMRRTESFTVDHDSRPLPTVKEAGIPKCLTLWRMTDSYQARHEECCFFLCTGKTEYIFSIKPENRDIYCGASYNLVFDLGLFGGGQFFRIRNYRDNRESWCGFFCDFSQEASDREIPTGQCAPGKFVSTEQGNLWCVKRYTDSEIVLQGCGEDEYIYRREGKREERFVL